MKKLSLAGLAFLCSIIANNAILAQETGKIVCLTGIAKNFNTEIQVEDMSELKDLELPSSERTFLPDSANHFFISFKLDKPNYFRIGRNILYLSPGDSLSMFIDYHWPDSATFTGKGSNENNYLRGTPFPKAGSFLQDRSIVKTSLQETIDAILSAAEKRTEVLRNCTNISGEFRLLENARIKADIINSLWDTYQFYPAINHLKGDSLTAFQQEFEKIIPAYYAKYSQGILNPLFLELVVYRESLSIIMKKATDDPINAGKIDDWIKAKKLAKTITGTDDKKKMAVFRPAIERIATPQYRLAVAQTFKRLMKFNTGDEAQDFIMRDSSGKAAHLNSFRGKVIYIDVWASWCGSCIADLPYIDSLKKKYRQNSDMVFVTLSIDEDKQKWKTDLIKRNMQGLQYIIDRAKLKAYNIAVIPRIIIINKDFKIAAMDADEPASSKTKPILDNLLQ